MNDCTLLDAIFCAAYAVQNVMEFLQISKQKELVPSSFLLEELAQP